MRRAVVFAMAALAVTGCATLRAKEARTTEDMLAAAGFHMEPADTPERTAELGTLPPRKITMQERDGTPYYVYADADGCHCMYVGQEPQYQEYRRLALKKEIDDELQEPMTWDGWGWRWR